MNLCVFYVCVFVRACVCLGMAFVCTCELVFVYLSVGLCICMSVCMCVKGFAFIGKFASDALNRCS